MLSYFSEQLAGNASRGLINRVTDVKLLQGDLAEAWRLTSSPSLTRKSFELIFISSLSTGCYRDPTSASKPEITSKSSSSMLLWRNWWKEP